jgi:hypothetical protein
VYPSMGVKNDLTFEYYRKSLGTVDSKAHGDHIQFYPLMGLYGLRGDLQVCFGRLSQWHLNRTKAGSL